MMRGVAGAQHPVRGIRKRQEELLRAGNADPGTADLVERLEEEH